VDDPFQDNFEGMEFLRATRLSVQEKEQLAHGNAERLLKLPLVDGSFPSYRESPAKNIRSSLFTFSAKGKSQMRRALISLLVK
jgi:hypothetical protein